MKVKVTLRRADAPVDLVVTADATATVGDIASRLAVSDPRGLAHPRADYTLHVTDPFGAFGRMLDVSSSIVDTDLLSGSTVTLVPADAAGSDAHTKPMAILRVLAGPDAGTDFPLPVGAAIIGRDRDVDVRLSDPLVSKRHARLNVGDAIEIVDLGSSNGVSVSGGTVERALVSGSDTFILGDTELCVIRMQQSAKPAEAPLVEHVRSPRVVERYPGQEFPAPTPPRPASRHRFPYLAMIAPLLLGLVLWALTRQVIGVVMMAMTPLLLVAGYVDQGVTARRDLKAQRRAFDEAIARTRERLAAERDLERRIRLQEIPGTAELADAVPRLGALVWTERPEQPGFLAVRAGIGAQPSRNRLVLPTQQDTLPACWEQLTALQEEFRTIDGVPIVVQLREAGAFGIAGADAARMAVARSILFQIVARHSPAEVVLAAFVSPGNRAGAAWLTWLPHTSSAHSPLTAPHLADNRSAATALLGGLESLLDERADSPTRARGPIDPDKPQPDEVTPPVVPAVVVYVDNDAPVDRGRLTRLVERGPDVGIHVVWCAPAVEQLPAACRAFLIAPTSAEDATVGEVRIGATTAPVAVETMDAETAMRLARALSPVVDIGSPVSDDSDLPRSVPYPLLTGLEFLDSPADVIERWRENQSLTPRDGSAPVPRRRDGTLRAVVGHGGTEPFSLDLRADGPHALVGGTTGSGKSEFLQSWVLGMASGHSPDRLTFLFVDYKGGAAFADCVALPHTVGLVTDLSPHLVRRALASLRAELRHRERLLRDKGANDLLVLERRGDPECPPSLVIVVDEFAALVHEVPEFVDGVVDVAQRGRSLGLHLILATQRPSGVIKDNLRANTNLRIALRMADAEDSTDILGDARAAHFDPAIPGRAAAKTGPGRIRAFQTAYAGGRTTGEPVAPQIEIGELDFGANAMWEAPETTAVERVESGPTDIARMVTTIRDAAAAASVPAPRRPWLPTLAAIYSFGHLANPRTDTRLLLGVADRPDAQEQPTVFYEPDRDGNLAVLGASGSGKSTTLRTIAVAAAATARNGGPTHVYGLDFGARGLEMLEGLPHVGAIVRGDDEERVVRTIRMLRDLVDDRARRFAAVRAGSLTEYRVQAAAPQEPRILLLVDGIGAFKEQYEFGAAHLSPWFTAFAQIAADGRQLGVHLIVAGDRPAAVPVSIAATVQRRIVLRMASEEEYLALGVSKDVLDLSSPPGRGILDGDEVQIAILGDSGNVAVQARELKRLAASLARADSAHPAPVRSLPERIGLDELPTTSGSGVVFGMDEIALGAAALTPKGPLLLAGPPGSGRTTTLQTLAAAVARADPGLECVLLSPRRRTSGDATWSRWAAGPDAGTLIAALLAELESGTHPRTALFVEALPEFAGTEHEYDLERMLRLAAREDDFIVAEGETSAWAQAHLLAQPIKSGRRALVLMPGDMDGDNLLGVSLGRTRSTDFPPGRGYLIEGGRAVRVQVAQTGGQW